MNILSIIPIILIVAVIIMLIGYKTERPINKIVAAITSIIIILVIAVPIIGESENNLVNTAYYDDYIEIENDDIVTGSFEKVTIGNKNYAHAIQLGKGQINSGNEIKEYTISKADLDVFLIMGQSNAAYSYYDVSSAEPIPKIGTTYYYGSSTSAMTTNRVIGTGMYDSISIETGLPIIGHLELPFMAEYYEKTHNKVYTINTGYEGAFVSQLAPNGAYYSYEQKVANDGISYINPDFYNITYKGYIWIQGESDAGYETPLEDYISSFMKLYKSISGTSNIFRFSDEFTIKEAYVIQCRTERSNSTAEALTYITNHYDNIHMATDITLTFTVDNGYMRSDNLHYSQKAYNLLGVVLADYIFEN